MTIINTTNGGGAKTIAGEEKPSSFPSEYPAPEGYDGWSKLTIDAPDNLSPENIAFDKTIAGVTGTYNGKPLTVYLENIFIGGGTAYTHKSDTGISTLTLRRDPQLLKTNVRKGATIEGVAGTYEPELQEKTVKAESFPVAVEPDSDKYGLSQATVTAPDNLSAENIRKDVTVAGIEGTYETPTQEKTLKPESFPTDVTPDAGYALSRVSVTSPDNLSAENIRKDVTIAGVTGTYEDIPVLAEVTKTPYWFPYTINTPAGYDGMSKVVLEADPTLLPGNIKEGVVISNVKGTYDGNKESNRTVNVSDVKFEKQEISTLPDQFEIYPHDGYDCLGFAVVSNDADSPLKPENIKKGVTIMGYEGTYEGSASGGLTFDADGRVKTPTALTADMFEGTTKLANQAFHYWASLKSVVLPDSVTSLGDSCFSFCTSLTSIAIPDSVTSLGNSCFYNCASLTSIVIPDSVTSLGNSCFSDCSKLASVTIPDGVTSVGNYCFNQCRSLTSIAIPDSVTSLGYSCFSNCTSLASIAIPDSVTSLGDSCFANCRSLASIAIPDGMTSLGNECFANCRSLASITIPDSVTKLGNLCFYDCTSLASVTMLPTTPPTLGSSAFASTASTLVITVPKGCLDAYKSATNWSAYADKMVEASE